MKAFRAACAALIFVTVVSCSKKPPVADVPAAQGDSGDASTVVAHVDEAARIVNEKLDERNYRLGTGRFRTEAHAAYLKDPLAFAPIPDQGIKDKTTAVVGSKVCVFYPNASVASPDDLASLPKGIPVPFGTIIPILGERVGDVKNTERNGMFEFQKNWNWFYPTVWEGKKGLVYGADLYGIGESAELNRISAMLYRSNGKYDAFYPIAGYRPLSDPVKVALERDRLSFQTVLKDEYYAWPDDMLTLYQRHRTSAYASGTAWDRKVPVFVTTDLAAHAQHLVFDRLLQYLEQTYFLPRLQTLNRAFLERLTARTATTPQGIETREKAIEYFQVAEALLACAPVPVDVNNDWGSFDHVEYRDPDVNAILSAYPETVREEVGKIFAAGGFAESSVFTFADGAVSKEDYSQYKPRGHYTKNGVLGAYFRAMMWFGRIHFLIAEAGPEPLEAGGAAASGGTSSDSTKLTLNMEPIALLVTDVVRSDGGLYRSWGDLFDPITALIGSSDDLSFREVLPLWKDQNAGDFEKWASSRENLVAFMKLAHEKLRPPAISGSSVFWGPSEGSGRNPPMGWRLFGQRFTYDSSVHNQVSPPRLMSRDMVRGLDIMKAFGSRTADALLAQTDYPAMDGLESRLDGIEAEFDGYNADFWNRTYYNQILYTVRAQARFESGTGFYFTESPAWDKKAMLSAHGTWAELRHDTILYVKQSYAERAGDGDYEPTYRTEPIPDPVHYIEPNVPFWQASVLSVQNIFKTLNDFKLLDEESAMKLRKLHTVFVRAAGIAELEAQNKSVPAADVDWICTIPAELGQVVMLHIGRGESISEDDLKMAIIADVYTNGELGQVLEVGVGIPIRLYVPLNDAQGGKRIAVGYGFSYYEFPHPMEDRLTDEQWKEIVYDDSADKSGYEPFWAKGLTVAPEKSE